MSLSRFVDTHVHFWDHSVEGLSWPFLDPGFEHPRLAGLHRIDAPRFTAAELRQLVGEVPLEKIVHIQCATEDRPGLEAAWLQETAEDTGWPHAFVTRSRLADPVAVGHLDADARRTGFRGVRDPHLADIGSEAFLAGWARLAELGGSVELDAPHELHAQVAAVARHRPDGTVVLGHAGLPVRRDADYREEWSAGLRRLAAEPNVVCKISALASGADPEWSVGSIRPWVEGCIEAFGPGRCMFATNWPIDRLHGSYPALVAAYDEITRDLPDADRALLFAGTAEATYDI